ncbi:MAG: 16S rRNA (uracil(1498)-N(3))-methyltransferase [Candidatus Margulisbacteria bacterium]|jgi:16S rRNA (uracil1498-N3)-methyltransferase|nr:16S rRNA (uracil(1498)-N(3))-methyltransferase [Candidatus Margulisiibacteriota bacterium]
MPRLFVPPADFPNLTGADAHYVRSVLRLKAGDELELLDGSGEIFKARIERADKEKVYCQVESSYRPDSEPKIKITLAQALPKGQKMDFVVEKAVELGVHRIIPVTTERTIAKGVKLDRWRKLAKEAAEQSGRAIVPEVSPLTDLAGVLKLKNDQTVALLPWELENEKSLKSALSVDLIARGVEMLVLIGPEGGFTQPEVEQARSHGWQTVSLGKRILRTETAGLAVLANILYELE